MRTEQSKGFLLFCYRLTISQQQHYWQGDDHNWSGTLMRGERHPGRSRNEEKCLDNRHVRGTSGNQCVVLAEQVMAGSPVSAPVSVLLPVRPRAEFSTRGPSALQLGTDARLLGGRDARLLVEKDGNVTLQTHWVCGCCPDWEVTLLPGCIESTYPCAISRDRAVICYPLGVLIKNAPL